MSLAPKGLRFHDFKMTNLIIHIVKNTFQTWPNFIPPESVKSIASVGSKIFTIEQKNVPNHTASLKSAKKAILASWSFKG